MAGEKAPKEDKKTPFKADWTPEEIERAMLEESITPAEVGEITRRAGEAAERWEEQHQKNEELFRRGGEVIKDAKLTGVNVEISALHSRLLGRELSKTKRVKTEREIRKLEKEKDGLEGREESAVAKAKADKEENKHKKKQPKGKEAAIPEFNEEIALELMQADEPEEVLKEMVEKSRVSPGEKETIGKVLQILEGVFNFDDRVNRLLEMQKTGALSDAVFYAFASALLKEDQEGISPIEVFRAFVRKAEELIKEYAGKEIPEGELKKLQEEVESLGREKARFFKSKFGSRVLNNAEKPAEQKADVSHLLRVLEVLLGESERKTLESTANIYGLLNKEVGFTASARSGQDPSYGVGGQFEIAMRMREWLSEKQDLAPAQRKEYGVLLAQLEGFLLDKGGPEIRQYISRAQEKGRREAALKKTTEGILRVNAELARTLGVEDPARLEEIKEEEKRGVRRAFGEVAAEIRQMGSLPLLEPLLKRVLSLNDLLGRLETNQEEVSGEARTELSREALELEALALVREFEARDRLASAAELADALSRARNPAEKRKIQNDILEKQREADDLFGRAEQIRRGE